VAPCSREAFFNGSLSLSLVQVVYSHALTSPSYPSVSTQSSLGSATVRHVLGFYAPFPPPESVLGPASPSSLDYPPGTAASEDAAEESNGYRAQCWAFAGTAGRFTVRTRALLAMTLTLVSPASRGYPAHKNQYTKHQRIVSILPVLFFPFLSLIVFRASKIF
jgi:hypothetical protein